MDITKQLDRTTVITKFSTIEAGLLVPYPKGFTSMTWMGIEFSWKRGTKREGCTLKRGKSYGKYKYVDTVNSNYKPDDLNSHGRELTREEAIEECLKPFQLRVANNDMSIITECACCGKIRVGRENERDKWGHLFWNKYVGESVFKDDRSSSTFALPKHEFVYLPICPECIGHIIKGDFKPTEEDTSDE